MAIQPEINTIEQTEKIVGLFFVFPLEYSTESAGFRCLISMQTIGTLGRGNTHDFKLYLMILNAEQLFLKICSRFNRNADIP